MTDTRQYSPQTPEKSVVYETAQPRTIKSTKKRQMAHESPSPTKIADKSEEDTSRFHFDTRSDKSTLLFTSEYFVREQKIAKKEKERRIALQMEEEELQTLLSRFEGLERRYRLIEKIGQGTFSSVYKAQDLVKDEDGGNGVVAIKKVYVTASPLRIYSELKFLYKLSGSRNIIPIVDALRYQDQILIVLPFCEHADFRDYYRDLPVQGIKVYMTELFQAIAYIHSKHVIHRDIKQNNFLFNPVTKRGVLVDFGLAESADDAFSRKLTCPCTVGGQLIDEASSGIEIKGYPIDDDRPARRANRAGTRGFRAPEVLLKCPSQTMKIDIWSAGVILLSLLSRRFPFFDSQDDVDAIVELASIFGIHKMKHCAALHGLGFDTNLPTLNSTSRSFSEICYWALSIENDNGTIPEDSVAYDTLECVDEFGNVNGSENGKRHREMFELLQGCMELSFSKRLSAEECCKKLGGEKSEDYN